MLTTRVIDAIRWRRLLASCKLSLDNLEAPLDRPSNSDFIIAGCPRSGTSLLAATLFSPPNVAVSMEPWDGLRLLPHDLFSSLRAEIDETGTLSRGRLDIEVMRSTRRVEWTRDSASATPISMSDNYHLGVKWPTFWQYLELLPTTKFLITIRHPVDVLASFERVGGRLGDGLDYDVPFNARMNSWLQQTSRDPFVRRALMYEYIYRRISPHLVRDNVLAVHYEEWFTDPDALKQRIARFLGLESVPSPIEVRKPPALNHPPQLTELVSKTCLVADELGYDI